MRKLFLHSAAAVAVVGLMVVPAIADDDHDHEKKKEPVKIEGTGKVLATYHDKEFTDGDFLTEIAKLNKRARKALEDPERRQQYIENHILSELLVMEGRKQGLHESDDIQKQLADLERRLVIQKVMQEHQNVPVEPADVRAYYDGHPEEFKTDQLGARHILVKEEELAKDLHKQLGEDASKFEELAKEHSVDKSNAQKGGDLGKFGRGRMVKEFEEAAFGLTEDNQISDIVKTRFGYHIIQRTARDEGTVRDFEEVKGQIKVRLVNEKRREQTQTFLDGLKSGAKFSVDKEALAAVDFSELPESPKPEGNPHLGHAH